MQTDSTFYHWKKITWLFFNPGINATYESGPLRLCTRPFQYDIRHTIARYKQPRSHETSSRYHYMSDVNRTCGGSVVTPQSWWLFISWLLESPNHVVDHMIWLHIRAEISWKIESRRLLNPSYYMQYWSRETSHTKRDMPPNVGSSRGLVTTLGQLSNEFSRSCKFADDVSIRHAA